MAHEALARRFLDAHMRCFRNRGTALHHAEIGFYALHMRKWLTRWTPGPQARALLRRAWIPCDVDSSIPEAPLALGTLIRHVMSKASVTPPPTPLCGNETRFDREQFLILETDVVRKTPARKLVGLYLISTLSPKP